MGPRTVTLPRAAPRPALALGAYLKNTACRIDGDRARASALHGDLGEVDACLALEASAHALLHADDAPPVAVLAHDAHPDFASTHLALALAAQAGVPARAVQHHRAHVGVVQAEAGLAGPVLGLALDGVGLGSDGTAWGGELLWADDPARSSRWRRLAHLPPLALPGGDRAAREPWRMAAALLHAQGRGDEIAPRLVDVAGSAAGVVGVAAMLQRGLNCPPTTAAGRWFDAAAAALGLHCGPQAEAEAAITLERAAAHALRDEPALPAPDITLDDLPALVASLFDLPPAQRARGAARFHLGLAQALARATVQQAHALDVGTVVLCGGCFFNRVLTEALTARLAQAGLRVCRPGAAGCGDAGLALGQAFLASWAQARDDDPGALHQPHAPTPKET
jgi:hydrogenase maturation protein HypF